METIYNNYRNNQGFRNDTSNISFMCFRSFIHLFIYLFVFRLSNQVMLGIHLKTQLIFHAAILK